MIDDAEWQVHLERQSPPGLDVYDPKAYLQQSAQAGSKDDLIAGRQRTGGALRDS